MHRSLCLILTTIVIIISGCESSERTETKTAPHQVVKAEKPINAEPPQSIASPLNAARNAADQAEARSVQVEQEAEAVAGEAEQTVPGVAKPAVEATEKAPAEIEKVTDVVNIPADKVSKKAQMDNQSEIPEEIILEASNGDVTFTHGVHADTVACLTCHGEGAPTAFGINKDVAHKLCKGCHKDGGAGPTGCRDCHIK